MPCYDDRRDEDEAEMKLRLDLATRVACELAKFIKGEVSQLSQESSDWISEHESMDHERNASLSQAAQTQSQNKKENK